MHDAMAGGMIAANNAKRGVEAGGTIVAGSGYGVYAGLAVRMADWPVSARVQAVARPEGLVSGYWGTP